MAFLKGIWKTNPSKHQKLSEELALQATKDEKEIIEDKEEITFKLKYLGCHNLIKTNNENLNNNNNVHETVKTLLKSSKSEKRKPQSVDLTISPKGIVVTDRSNGEDVLKISIYEISNCCTDATNPRIFSFTASPTSDKEIKEAQCYVFCCGKRKLSENVALSVAKAFSNAYEEWRILPSTKEFQNQMIHQNGNEKQENIQSNLQENTVKQIGRFEEQLLIRFEDEDNLFDGLKHYQKEWVCFDDELKLY